jgi:hypothetical protein
VKHFLPYLGVAIDKMFKKIWRVGILPEVNHVIITLNLRATCVGGWI